MERWTDAGLVAFARHKGPALCILALVEVTIAAGSSTVDEQKISESSIPP